LYCQLHQGLLLAPLEENESDKDSHETEEEDEDSQKESQNEEGQPQEPLTMLHHQKAPSFRKWSLVFSCSSCFFFLLLNNAPHQLMMRSIHST
jgi:hypothetical protein